MADVDLDALANNANKIGSLILVTPNNKGYRAQGEFGLEPKFLFDIEADNAVNLQSDITDYFVEDNTAIQDQIALRPILVTTRGLVAELNNRVPEELQLLRVASDRLGVVQSYQPELSVSAQIVYNQAFQAYQAAERARRATLSIGQALLDLARPSVISPTGVQIPQVFQNRQQKAFSTFYGYWNEKKLFTIQTPWAIFQNMAIESLEVLQNEETNTVTDFQITFKKINFARTLFQAETKASRAAQQSAEVQVLSPSKGSPVTSSPLAKVGL